MISLSENPSICFWFRCSFASRATKRFTLVPTRQRTKCEDTVRMDSKSQLISQQTRALISVKTPEGRGPKNPQRFSAQQKCLSFLPDFLQSQICTRTQNQNQNLRNQSPTLTPESIGCFGWVFMFLCVSICLSSVWIPLSWMLLAASEKSHNNCIQVPRFCQETRFLFHSLYQPTIRHFSYRNYPRIRRTF